MAKEQMGMTDQLSKQIGKYGDSSLKLTGYFKLDHIRNGAIIDTREFHNTMMNAGFVEVAALLGTDTTSGHTAFDYIAIGTGTTAPAATQTALVAEASGSGATRATGTGTNVTSTWNTSQNDTFQLVTTFSFLGTFAITEAGVFNASSGGVMLCRRTFSVMNVESGDSLQTTYRVSCHL